MFDQFSKRYALPDHSLWYWNHFLCYLNNARNGHHTTVISEGLSLAQMMMSTVILVYLDVHKYTEGVFSAYIRLRNSTIMENVKSVRTRREDFSQLGQF